MRGAINATSAVGRFGKEAEINGELVRNIEPFYPK